MKFISKLGYNILEAVSIVMKCILIIPVLVFLFIMAFAMRDSGLI